MSGLIGKGDKGWVPKGVNFYLSPSVTRDRSRTEYADVSSGWTLGQPGLSPQIINRVMLNPRGMIRGEPIIMHGEPYDGKLSRTVRVAASSDHTNFSSTITVTKFYITVLLSS